jgi:hypothetical protein
MDESGPSSGIGETADGKWQAQARAAVLSIEVGLQDMAANGGEVADVSRIDVICYCRSGLNVDQENNKSPDYGKPLWV